MAQSQKTVAAKVRAQASGSARRTGTRDKRVLGPYPVIADNPDGTQVEVGTVEVVERPRRKGEPSVLVVERDGNGAPTAPSFLGALALAAATA